jgi:hypothetical protein
MCVGCWHAFGIQCKGGNPNRIRTFHTIKGNHEVFGAPPANPSSYVARPRACSPDRQSAVSPIANRRDANRAKVLLVGHIVLLAYRISLRRAAASSGAHQRFQRSALTR